MYGSYPVVLTQGDKYVVAYVPDFGINTQGKDKNRALWMAYDAIGLTGIDMEDDGQKIPEPTSPEEIRAQYPSHDVECISINFERYRFLDAKRGE